METLLRLDAVADRAIYAMVANILIGTVIALVLLRFLLRGRASTREVAGRHSRPVAAAPRDRARARHWPIRAQARRRNPFVVANGEAFSSSAAEVIVCCSRRAAV